MTDSPPLDWFEAFGVELEYMIVDDAGLSVRPIADELLKREAGELVSDVERGPITWSNELVLHVVELKTTDPARELAPLPALFQGEVNHINALLALSGARLMPTAMHPTMDPHHEMRLWPHDSGEIYAAFDRIFDCSGHGWANLQSVHLNLPFADDSQFAPLHAAVRLLLPLLPALAASSPVAEGRVTGLADTRLDAYGANARRIPSVSGSVVPEPAFSRADYEQSILQVIYRDMAAHDPHGILRYEWVNARGAIARFDRNTIEIRLLDMQECPLADVAICAAVVEVLRALTHGRWTDPLEQQKMPTEPLAEVLRATIAQGDRAVIRDQALLRQFGLETSESLTAGELWRHLIQQVGLLDDPATPWREPLSVILNQGPLSRRITHALGTDASLEHIHAVYRRLCDCLASGAMFTGA